MGEEKEQPIESRVVTGRNRKLLVRSRQTVSHHHKVIKSEINFPMYINYPQYNIATQLNSTIYEGRGEDSGTGSTVDVAYVCRN